MNPVLPFDDAPEPSDETSSDVSDSPAFSPEEETERDGRPGVWDLAETHLDDPADATDRMLEVIATVDFLRRGDRRTITLWAAIEEALRWWVLERVALLDGYVDGSLDAPRFGEQEALRATLLSVITTAAQDEPVHINQALQEALRRWTTTMADRYNDRQPWPAPAPRHLAPRSFQLSNLDDDDPTEPPDLVA